MIHRRRQRWEWHPDAADEADLLHADERRTFGQLAARLHGLTGSRTGRLPGAPALGRIHRLPIIIDEVRRVVLFVKRDDGRGYGGLLLHRCTDTADCPPAAAYELARARLAGMPDW